MFIMANVNVINENNSVEDIAHVRWITLPKKEKDWIDLLKTLNLYETDMDNKDKHFLKKTAEKFYKRFIDGQELRAFARETARHAQQIETT